MNAAKEMQPMIYFSHHFQESPIFWQLKLDSGIEVMIRDGIICHFDCFYAGTKSCYFTETQLSNIYNKGQWVNMVLDSTSILDKM